MKKKLYVILTLCLVVVLAVAMTACKNKLGVTGGDASVAADYDYTRVQSNLDAMRTGQGFLIRYKGTTTGTEASDNDEGTMAYGAKGGIYYVASDEDETYYDMTNDAYIAVYDKNKDEEGNVYWTKDVNYYNADYTKEQAQTEMNAQISAASAWMTYYGVNAMDGGMKKSGATVIGRSCDKYEWGVNMVVYKINYTCYIDKSTGICLKWTGGASAVGASAGVNFECEEFNTNPTFTLPTVSADNTREYGNESGQEGGGNGNTTPGGQGQGGSESGSQEGGQGSGSQGGGQEGGQQGGGNEGGESAGTSITADYPNATNSAIVDALIPNGFRVTYTLGAGVDANGNVSNNNLGTYTFAAKGDVYFIVSSNESAYFDFGESAEYYVDYRMQNGSWKRHNVAYGEDTDYTSADAAKTALRQVINSYMTLGAQYANLQGLTKTSETYLSRAADKYAKKDVPAQGYEEEYLIKMDKQTGAVLFFYDNLYPAGAVDYTYVVSHVATEFTVGYDVVLPEVASNLTTIGAKHSPDDVATAMIAEAARENGLSVRLVNETDYSRDVYEIWIKNNKIKYTFFSEEKESGDTIADYVYYVDATVQGNAKVYECAGEETPYELDGSYYYLYDGVEDFTDYVSIFGVLGDYWFCIEDEAALTEDVYHGSRNVDVYTFTEYEATMKIDQKTHAVLYYKEGDKDFATYTCEDVYTDFTDEIEMPVESV